MSIFVILQFKNGRGKTLSTRATSQNYGFNRRLKPRQLRDNTLRFPGKKKKKTKMFSFALRVFLLS